MTPQRRSGPRQARPDTINTNHLPTTITDPADAERQRRRLRLHRTFVIRRGVSRELDELLVEMPTTVGISEPGIEGDYWADSWMDRGVTDREHHGRELLAAGYVPRWSA